MKPHDLSRVRRIPDSITDTSNGFNVDSVVTKFLPQPADMCIKCSGSCFAMISPHLVHQHFACSHIAAGAHQFFEKVEFLGGKSNRAISRENLAPLRKQADLADTKRVSSVFAYAPKDRLHAQYELARAERLHDIVVG